MSSNPNDEPNLSASSRFRGGTLTLSGVTGVGNLVGPASPQERPRSPSSLQKGNSRDGWRKRALAPLKKLIGSKSHQSKPSSAIQEQPPQSPVPLPSQASATSSDAAIFVAKVNSVSTVPDSARALTPGSAANAPPIIVPTMLLPNTLSGSTHSQPSNTSPTVTQSLIFPSLWEKTLERTKKRLAEKNLQFPEINNLPAHSADDNLQQVVHKLRSAHTQMQDKRLSFVDRNGKKVFVMDKLAYLLKIMDKYAKIVDVAIQHSPEITALVWAGVRTAMQVALNHSEAMECFEATMAIVTEKLAKCEFYASIYAEGLKTPAQVLSAANDKQIQETLDFALPELYAAIILFSIKARQYFDTSGMRKFANMWKPFILEIQPFIDDIMEKEKCVREHAEMASMERIMEGSKTLAQMVDLLTSMEADMKSLVHLNEIQDSTAENLKVTKEILRRDIKKEDQEILGLLSPLEPLKRHADIRALRLENTGTWLLQLDQFCSWRDTRTEQSNRVLCCYGIPGAGKSTLCSLVIDSLDSQFDRDSKIGIACLYSDFRDQSNQNLPHILGTFLHQLITSTAVFGAQDNAIKTLAEIKQRKKKVETRDILNMLSLTLQSLDCAFICIDALDELDIQVRRELLETLSADLKGVRLFLTGRPHVRDEVRKSLHVTEADERDISANTNDIEMYLRDKIKKDASLSPEAIDEDLENEIIQTIIQQSQGMFLLPALHIDLILEKPTKSFRRTALAFLPSDLYTAYDRVVARIQNSRRHNDLGMRILMWLHFAYRPLKIPEFQHALAVKQGDTGLDEDNIPSQQRLLDSCFGLVIVDEETDTVRFVHFSVEEFFRKFNGKYFIEHCSPVAEVCLTYLSFTPLTKSCSDFDELNAMRGCFVFLDYAASYWGHYIATNRCVDRVTGLVLKFLTYEEHRPPCSVQITLHGVGHLDKLRELNFLHRFAPELFIEPPERIQTHLSALHVATYFNLEGIMKVLCTRGDAIVKDETGRTPLSWVAALGRVEIARILMERDVVDVDAKDNSGRTPLALAAQNGHVEVVRLLAERDDTDVHAKDEDGRTPLALAAWKGYLEVVQLLLQLDDIDVNAQDKDGRSPVSLAAAGGRIEVVRVLVGRGNVDVHTKDHYGRTPLSLAAQNGHVEVVRLLAERDDTDVHAKDEDGRTPLALAARIGYLEVVQQLLQLDDIDVNAQDKDGRSPVSLAAEEGCIEVVRVLVGRGDVDVHAKDHYGRTPLSLAAEKGQIEVVRLLAERDDTVVNAKDEDGRTPLALAVQKGYLKVVQLLLQRDDIDVNAQDKDGRSPVSLAAAGGHIEVVRVLVGRGNVDVHAKDHYGRTPLSLAAEKGRIEVVRLLAERGDTDVNAKDEDGRTPLALAVQKGYLKVVQLLLQRDDIDVNAQDKDCGSPLSLALENGHVKVVRLLAERGDTDINARLKDGRTPLVWAACKGDREVIRLLVDRHDAHVNTKDENGRTPLEWAIKYKHLGAISKLAARADVDVNVKDSEGKTPLARAAQNGDSAVVWLLARRKDLDVNSTDNLGKTPLDWATEGGHDIIIKLLTQRGGVMNVHNGHLPG